MTPRELEASQFALVNYYRCGECGHVWTTDKETNATLTHVTPLRPVAQPATLSLKLSERE